MERILPVRYLRKSGMALAASVCVCVAMQPAAVFTHYGFSYYGNFRTTSVPFCTGLVVTAYFLMRAAMAIGDGLIEQARRMRASLVMVAASIVGLVMTPSLSTVRLVQEFHIVFGTVIFVVTALMSLRYMVWLRHRLADWVLLFCQMSAIVMIILSFEFLSSLNFMLPAQLMAACAWGVLLLRYVGYQLAKQSSGLSGRQSVAISRDAS